MLGDEKKLPPEPAGLRFRPGSPRLRSGQAATNRLTAPCPGSIRDPVRPGRLSSREFGSVAQQLQGFRHLVAVVSLDLDGPILDRAAGAAQAPQVFAQGLEGGWRQVQVIHYGHGLAAAPLRFAADVRFLLPRRQAPGCWTHGQSPIYPKDLRSLERLRRS